MAYIMDKKLLGLFVGLVLTLNTPFAHSMLINGDGPDVQYQIDQTSYFEPIQVPLFAPLSTSPITFDPQGTGGANGVTIGGFGFGTNNMLAVGETEAGVGDTFELYGHTNVIEFILADGSISSLPGLNADFEFTVTFGFLTEVTARTNGDLFFSNVADPSQDPSYYRMYADVTVNADALSGQGFDDGTPILEAYSVELTGLLSRIGGTETFDQFGADNYNGLQSIISSGSMVQVLLISFIDPDYFPDLDVGSLINLNTEISSPFNDNDPSRQFTDQDGGVINPDIGYSVPEPTTLALLSLGLAGLCFTRRRMKV